MAKSSLIDPRTNKPFALAKAELTSEQGGASIASVRSPYGEHPVSGLTPGRLARILRGSIDGDAIEYLELAEDMEERDPHYAGVLGIRKRQVAGLDMTVEAAGDDQRSMDMANAVRELVERDQFLEEVIDILDAVGKGFSATEIIWETSASQWMPARLEHRDPRFFRYDFETGRDLLLREAGGDRPLDPFKWIVHSSKVKTGLPIRGGLARAVAWPFLFKSFNVKDWAVFCEAYGQPVRLGKYHPNATEKDKQTLLRAVASIGTDYAAIIPEGMLIELIEANVTGNHELFERRCDWLDRQVSKVVLGQTATTDAIAGGHAVGKVHDEVRGDIEEADARQLGATLNRDLVRPFIDLNYGPQQRYPKLRVGRPEEVDVTRLMGNVKTFVDLGGRVGEAVIRDKLGLPDPEDGEELLGAAARPQAQPVPVDGPDAAPAATTAARQRHDHDHEPDAIDRTVDAITGDQWDAVVAPVIDGLAAEIADAQTMGEVRAILDRRADTMSMSQMTELIASLSFQARLSGEADEDIS